MQRKEERSIDVVSEKRRKSGMDVRREGRAAPRCNKTKGKKEGKKEEEHRRGKRGKKADQYET
jgi:hypothetical protein